MQKIINYLIYLFIFLLPWQTQWIIFDSPSEYLKISIYSFDIIFIILLILFFFSVTITSAKAGIQKLDEIQLDSGLRRNDKMRIIFFITLLLCYSISFIFTDNKLMSFYWFLRILQAGFLIYIINKISLNKIKAVWTFILSVSLSAILGIYQFLIQNAFASKLLGLASHSASILGDSVVEFLGEPARLATQSVAGGRWLRAYGSFPHPNILAGFIVIAIVLCFYLLKHKNIKALKQKLLYYFITLLLIAALFFTFSRAAWIAFGLCILYYVVCSKYKNYLLIAGCLLLVSCLIVIYSPLVKTRIVGAERLEVKSNTERISGYNDALKIIKNNLLLGTGLGNYTVELQKLHPDQPIYFYQPVHNIYLLILAEVGILGFLIIILLLYYFITYSSFLFSIFSFLFLFDHYWFTLPSGLILVFLLFSFSTLDRKVLSDVK